MKIECVAFASSPNSLSKKADKNYRRSVRWNDTDMPTIYLCNGYCAIRFDVKIAVLQIGMCIHDDNKALYSSTTETIPVKSAVKNSVRAYSRII